MSNTDVGFVGLLTLLFIGLKLGKVIAWSWFWVLSPIWISLILVLMIVVGGIWFLILSSVIKKSKKSKKNK